MITAGRFRLELTHSRGDVGTRRAAPSDEDLPPEADFGHFRFLEAQVGRRERIPIVVRLEEPEFVAFEEPLDPALRRSDQIVKIQDRDP